MDDPTTFQAFIDVVDTIGTLGLAILIVWAFYMRKVVTTKELDENQKTHAAEKVAIVKDWSDRLAYVEDRRKEEREYRLQAEQRLQAALEAVDDITDLMQAIKDEVIRGQSHA